MRRYPVVLATLALLLAAAAPATAAKVRTGPAGTAFYTPPKPLPGSKHGDLIWARKLTGQPALASAGKNTLVLYRSEGIDGKPIAVSGTVSVPKGKAPKSGWPVITYDHGTTGIADICAPSRDATNNPAHTYNNYIYPLLNRWLKAGYAVVRTDYQGLGTPGTHEYFVGVAEGRSTLDIARAARKLDPRLSNRIAIAGHSQGGHAALWAADLAPKWTPDLKLHATVAFAPGSHTSELLSAFQAAHSPAGGLSAEASLILRAIEVSKPSVNVPSLITDKLAALYPQTLTKCQGQLAAADSIGGLAPADFLKSDADTTQLSLALDSSDPENLTIKSPVAVEQGSADTTVAPGLTDDLVKQYRQRGTKVDYKTYDKVTHGGVVVAAAVHATKYIQSHLH
jgi:pimeloyl-ACP methyl ester carboxylesterase